MNICPSCHEEIPAGAPVVFRKGQVYHLRCAEKADANNRKREDERQRGTDGDDQSKRRPDA